MVNRAHYSEPSAAGSKGFVVDLKQKFDLSVKHREVVTEETRYLMRETSPAYNTDFGAKKHTA